MSNDSNVVAAAKRLRQASASGQVCAPIRELIGTTDLDKAYAIQEINSRLRVEEGARPVGSKIGLTSPAVQQQLGVNQPDFGLLWNDTEVVNGGEISVKEIIQPKAEAEIAFVLAKDLTAKRLTTLDVISAIDYALASIEIVGSRIKDWDIQITDTIADNASASHWVVGHRPAKLSAIDLINCKMSMSKNGEVVSEGRGRNCLGSPLNAMLWLARQMVSVGKPLRAGDLILTGALGPMVSVVAGDHFSATIEGLGEVSVNFTD